MFELDLSLRFKVSTCSTEVVAHVELNLSDLVIHFPKFVDTAQIFIYAFGLAELKIFVEIDKASTNILLPATP